MMNKVKNTFKKKENLTALIVLFTALCLLIGLAIGIPLTQNTDNTKKANNLLEKYILLDGYE